MNETEPSGQRIEIYRHNACKTFHLKRPLSLPFEEGEWMTGMYNGKDAFILPRAKTNYVLYNVIWIDYDPSDNLFVIYSSNNTDYGGGGQSTMAIKTKTKSSALRIVGQIIREGYWPE